MNHDSKDTLLRLLRALGRMVEDEPSLVANKDWQMASEGTARLLKFHGKKKEKV